mgnify:CR=1 FL=1|jgi:hypothetical protein
MEVTKKHTIITNSSVEKTFKAPIYLDVRLIMTGYGPLPKSEGVTNDETWANPKGKRTVLAFGKELCSETIIERIENKYWKYELTDFKQKSFFFVRKVTGEIWVNSHQNNKCKITSKYTFSNRNIITLPISYLFVKILWSGLQKKGLKNMKKLLENNTAFYYPINS